MPLPGILGATGIIGAIGGGAGTSSGGSSGLGSFSGILNALKGLFGGQNLSFLKDALSVIKTGDLSNWGASGDWNKEKAFIESEMVPHIEAAMSGISPANVNTRLRQMSRKFAWFREYFKTNLKYHAKATITKQVMQQGIEFVNAMEKETIGTIEASLSAVGFKFDKQSKQETYHALTNAPTGTWINYTKRPTAAQWDSAFSGGSVTAGSGGVGSSSTTTVPKPPAYSSWHPNERNLYDAYIATGHRDAHWNFVKANKDVVPSISYFEAMGLTPRKESKAKYYVAGAGSSSTGKPSGGNVSNPNTGGVKQSGTGFLFIVLLVIGAIAWGAKLFKRK